MRALLLLPILMAAQAADPLTLPALLTRVQAIDKAAPGTWATIDLDGDGRPSQVEILATLPSRTAWWRSHAPDVVKALDRDQDQAISRTELGELAGTAPGANLTLSERKRSARAATAPMGVGGGGTSIGAGGGAGASRAYIAIINQQAYIADYDVRQGQYDPIVGIIGYGTVLDVADVSITIYRR